MIEGEGVGAEGGTSKDSCWPEGGQDGYLPARKDGRRLSLAAGNGDWLARNGIWQQMLANMEEPDGIEVGDREGQLASAEGWMAINIV